MLNADQEISADSPTVRIKGGLGIGSFLGFWAKIKRSNATIMRGTIAFEEIAPITGIKKKITETTPVGFNRINSNFFNGIVTFVI